MREEFNLFELLDLMEDVVQVFAVSDIHKKNKYDVMKMHSRDCKSADHEILQREGGRQ